MYIESYQYATMFQTSDGTSATLHFGSNSYTMG